MALRQIGQENCQLNLTSAPGRRFDCIVIGGGPAGLTAAIYLARFHLSVMVVEDGRSRACLIPVSHNHAGFPEGIAGAELVRRMSDQAQRYGAEFRAAKAAALSPVAGGFLVSIGDRSFHARAVLLATGVVNRRLAMPDDVHDEALFRGLLRYCPICDGYEVTDSDIAILGSDDHALREAEFLRSYTARVTLISPEETHRLGAEQISRAGDWGIVLADGPIRKFAIDGDRIAISLPGGVRHFDSAYMAIGSDIRSELASAAGAKLAEDGCILVDRHQATSIEGLYAAGDVVLGLDQISNAMGQAGVAATAIRNALCAKSPLRR